MAIVYIDNLQRKSIISKDKSEKLLHTLLKETDWMHACGGKGRCTSCKALILEGMENISDRTKSEKQFMNLERLKEQERLTCQVTIEGDITIYVQKENRLPHLTYN